MINSVYVYVRAALSVNDWYPLKTLAACVVGGFVLWASLYFAAKNANLGYCMAVSTAVVVSAVIIRAGRAVAPAPREETPPPESPPPNEDLYFLEYRLSAGKKDRSQFEQRVRPLLTRLAEERLVQRHGIDPHHEPEKARSLVGEQLWVLMTGPPELHAKPPNAREVSRWVDQIEAI